MIDRVGSILQTNQLSAGAIAPVAWPLFMALCSSQMVYSTGFATGFLDGSIVAVHHGRLSLSDGGGLVQQPPEPLSREPLNTACGGIPVTRCDYYRSGT